MSYYGVSIDGNWAAEQLLSDKITLMQFMDVSGFTVKRPVFGVNAGILYVWDNGRQRKPWEKTAKDHRASKEYKEWRLAVFERDNFTCQKCGQVRGQIQAHHLFTFIRYPKLRYTVTNGITLCFECHIDTHKEARRCKKVI